MVRMWFLLFVVLAWHKTEAFDADVLANRVLTRINEIGVDLAQSYYRLPGFNISFSYPSQPFWNVHDGRAVSTGRWPKTGPAALNRSGNNLFLTIPLMASELQSNYTFDCSDNSGRHGTYEMSTKWSYDISIKLKIDYDGPFNCVGAVYGIDLSRIPNCELSDNVKFDGEGVDGPGTSCAYQSWPQRAEYLTPFRKNFCGSYYNAVTTLVQHAAEAAITEGFNFCPL